MKIETILCPFGCSKERCTRMHARTHAILLPKSCAKAILQWNVCLFQDILEHFLGPATQLAFPGLCEDVGIAADCKTGCRVVSPWPWNLAEIPEKLPQRVQTDSSTEEEEPTRTGTVASEHLRKCEWRRFTQTIKRETFGFNDAADRNSPPHIAPLLIRCQGDVCFMLGLITKMTGVAVH